MTPRASVVVDTMVVYALVNAGRDPSTAARWRAAVDDMSIVVSFVTVTELRSVRSRRAGANPATGPGAALAQLVVVQPDDDLMRVCGQLRSDSWASGHALGYKSPRGRPVDPPRPWSSTSSWSPRDEVIRNIPGLVVAGAAP